MANRFANGAKAFGFCDVCGFRFDLKKLKNLVVKTKQTQIKACPQCWTPDHPQLQLGMYPVADPQAIRDPRPDTNTWYQSGTNGLQTTPVSGLLPANPFTSNGTAVISVNAPNHGIVTGDYATFSGAVVFNGATIAGQYQVTVLNPNSYTITYSTTVAAGVGGGSAVAFSYTPTTGNTQNGFPGEGMLVIQWGWNPIGGARDFDAVLTPNTLVGVGEVGTVTAGSSNAPAADPYFASVKLLLHMDGTAGSTTFVDNSPVNYTMTAFGDAQVNTAIVKFGTGSLISDGAGDYLQIDYLVKGYISATAGTPWTAELWVYSAIPAGIRWNSTSATQFTLGISDGITSADFLLAPITVPGLAATSYPINTAAWNFITVVNDPTAGAMLLYINGIQAASQGNKPMTTMGRISGPSTTSFNGYIDEVRITVGVARYTGNFTPPTSAFPNY